MKTFTHVLMISAIIMALFATTQVVGQNEQSPTPVVEEPVYFDISPPLTEMTPTNTPSRIKSLNKEGGKRDYPFYEYEGEDPVWQKEHGTSQLTDDLGLIFDGTPLLSGLAPSDDNGDIGLNHYVQTVNSKLEIYDRAGNTVYGPVNINTLFSGVPGGNTNDGDPIVLYDQVADRWLISQFSIGLATKYILIAVSQTSDPTGSYYRYSYSWGSSVPDYPKFGVWRDSYLMGLNCGTDDIVAFNRSQMIAGNATAQVVKFDNPWRPNSGLHCVQPLDNDGQFAPAGTPGHFITINDNAWGGSDQLWIYELSVNWIIPWWSTFNRVQQINVAGFDSNFGGTWDNIPQPGTAQKLELLPQVLMYRAQYRNFGSYESIVCCHDVDVSGSDHAGIRWYELRRYSGNWYIYQQGTYAPDSHHRWMGGIAQNGSGEIALGYTISSSSIYPSIRYTGRKPSDPLGTMGFAEGIIHTGSNSQTSGNRWGDYTSMSVDPANDKTFWYTSQYTIGAYSWRTKIAAFEFDGYCEASSNNCDEYIARVEIGSIDNSSDCDNYRDYSYLSTEMPVNGSESIEVTNGSSSYIDDQCGIWIDWNQDEDFFDANEEITVSGTPGYGPYTATISPPVGVTTGDYKMRIRITYTGDVEPCGTTSWGEVEDYTLTLTSAIANVWTGDFNRYWHNANNWSLGHIPTAADPVEIPDVGWQPCTVDDYPAIANESCKSLLLEEDAGLRFYNQELIIQENANIYGDVSMEQEDAEFTIKGDLTWFSGSSLDANHNSTYIKLYGIWEAKNGSDLDPGMGFVDFVGSTDAYIRSYDPGNKFYNLRIYKTGGAYLGLSTYSTQPLRVKNLIFVSSGAVFNNYDSEDIILEGAFNFYGTFDMTFNNNSSSFIFDGANSGLNDYDSGSGIFNNVVFSASNQAVAYTDFQVSKNLTIEQGTFNANGYTVSVAGNWTNSVGPDGFNETDSRVIFNGPGHQYVYGDEHFDILEVNNGAALRLNNSSYDVTCNVYDWTAGGIDIIAGNFTANDLLDNGLFGGFWVNPGGTINLTNDGWVDLNGALHNFGGTINVTGTVSDWSYSADALVEMTAGVIDFKTCGISIVDYSGHQMITNITGGTVKTANSFNNQRDDVDLSSLTVEMYGSTSANIFLDPSSPIYELKINKSENPESLPENETGSNGLAEYNFGKSVPGNDKAISRVIPPPSNTKDYAVLATGDLLVTNNLTIQAGTFNVNGKNVTVGNDVQIYGTLAMTDPAGDLTADFVEWFSGSEDNVTAGTIHATDWRFNEGTNAMIDPGNTAYVYTLYYSLDEDAEFGNLVGVASSKLIDDPENRAYYPTRVSGDFTLQDGAVWSFSQPDAGVIVDGDASIEEGASISFSNNDLIVDGNINIAGALYVYNEALALVHGEISWPETGELYINSNAEVIFDAPNHAKGWEYINGHVTLSEGLFEVSNNSIRFSETATTNVSGGIMRTAGAFYAKDPNVFEPTGGTVEIVGGLPDVNVFIEGGNFFYNLLIDREPDAYTDLEDASSITIKNDLTIISGILDTKNADLLVGGDWANYVGDAGFIEHDNTVWFYGEDYSHILTNETFYDLIIFDYLTDHGPENGGKIVEETYIEDGVDVNVLNNCRFLGGSLNMGSNSVLDVDNDFIFNGGQLIVPDGTQAELFVGGDYTNFNPGQAFFPGNSTFTFDGSANQEITTDYLTVYFYNLNIDNPGNLVKFYLNTHVYGDVHVINGAYVNAGIFDHINTFEGDINVEPAGALVPKGTINFEGNENTIFNDQATTTSYLWGQVNVNKATDNLQLLIADDMIILNGYSIDVLNGEVDLNGGVLRCTENVTIHDGGKILVDAGANLEVGDDDMLAVQNGGTLEVVGSPGNPATVSAWNYSLGHRYNFIIEDGGYISASNAIIEYLKGGYGVYVMEGATVDPAHSFDFCEFRYGESNGLSTFLTINNDQVLTITGASFPDASCDYNVGKDLNQGHLTFVDFAGDFSGEDYDYDPNNLIDWYVPTLEAIPMEQNVGAPAGSTTFDIISNLAWTASESVAWFSISPGSGTGNGLLTVNYQENTSLTPRTGTITLSAPEVPDVILTVNQGGVEPYLVVAPSNRNVSALAGSTTFVVSSNTSWTVNESVPWFTVSPMGGTNNKTLVVNYQQNLSVVSRVGSITVSSSGLPNVTVTVTQAGADVILSVSPDEKNVGAPAGSTSFNITSNTSWTVSESVGWFSVTPGSGSGNGGFTVNYSENTSINPRSGNITVSAPGATDVVVSVNQAGADVILSVSPDEQNVGAPAGNTSFSVTSNTSWTVTESVGWFSVTPGSGWGNGGFTVNYSENTSINPRSGNITVSATGVPDVVVSVNQAGAGVILIVLPNEQNVGPEAGNTAFNIISNTSWTVDENTGWLSVSPVSGSGNGGFTVTYNENTGINPRSAGITVSAAGSPDIVVMVNQGTYLIHEVSVPTGWSGLSSYIMPVENSIADVMAPISTNFIILQSMDGIFYPDESINTIGTWDSHAAYKIKLSANAVLDIIGEEELNKTFGMDAGWSMMPVIANIPVDVSTLFGGADLKIVKDIAGIGLLWPEYNINTLGDVLPGLAYMVKMNTAGSVVFPPNAKQAASFEYPRYEVPDSPWNKTGTGPASHAIAILSEGYNGIMPGDVVAVFDETGSCNGLVEISSLKDNAAIVAIADDSYSLAQDGFVTGEEMILKAYRPQTGEVFDIEASFDEGQPNTSHFAENGISVITSLKVSSVGINQALANAIGLYPNPTDGKVKVSGIEDFNKLEIFNATGKLERIINTDFNNEIDLDFSDLPAGVYQLRFTGNQNAVVKRLVRK